MSRPGCGSDRDCKLDRICEEGRCIWRDQTSGAASNRIERANGARTALPDVRDAGAANHGQNGHVPDAGTSDPDRAPHSMFRGDPFHRGQSPFVMPKQKPLMVWRYKTQGPISGSPAFLADGTLAVGSHDQALHIVGPTGSKRFAFATGDLIFSSPATTASGIVYVGSDDDHLYAFSSAPQKLLWRFRLGNCRATIGVGPEASRCDAQGGPTIGFDGTLYAGGNGIYALSPTFDANGSPTEPSILWHFELPQRVAAAPTLLTQGGVVAGSLDDTLYALSPAGDKLWDFRAGGDIESTAAVAPDGTIYVGSDDHKLYALTQHGELLWALQTGGDIRASPAIGKDGTILVGSFDGSLYAVAADGTLLWTFRTADRIVSSAVVDANGAVLFGSQDDHLYALEPDGALRWSVELGADVDSSPILGPDGSLFVGADDGNLYALKGHQQENLESAQALGKLE